MRLLARERRARPIVLARQPRSPQSATKPSKPPATDQFAVTVIVQSFDAINVREVWVRAAMQLLEIRHDAAQDLVDQMGIESRLLTDQERNVRTWTIKWPMAAMTGDDAAKLERHRQEFAALPAPARAELTDEINERFWKRSGLPRGSRVQGAGDPRALLWLRTLDDILGERELRGAERARQEAATENLVAQWEDAVAQHRWDDAARAWGAFSAEDGKLLLGELSPAQLRQLDAAAARTNVVIPRDELATAIGPEVPARHEGERLGWWGVSSPDEIRAAARHAQTFDSFEGAIAYGQSLGHPAGVVEEDRQFAVYDLNRALSSTAYPFSQNNVHIDGKRTNVKALPGVRAFVTIDGAVLEPRWGSLGPHPTEVGWVYGDWMIERDQLGPDGDPFLGHVEAFGSGLMQITDKDKFLAQFQKAMRDAAFAALDVSLRQTDELQRAFSSGLPPSDADRIKQTATDLESKEQEIKAAADEAGAARAEVDRYTPLGPGETRVKSGYTGQGGVVDPAVVAAAQARRQKAEADLERLGKERAGIVRAYPMLSYVEDIAAFNRLDDAGKARALHNVTGDILGNIHKTRALVRDALDRFSPELDLFALDNLVNTTIAGLGVTGEEHRAWIKERQDHAAWVKGITDIAFAVISIGLAAAAIFATGGAAAVVAIGSLGVAAADAIRTTGTYYEKQWMTKTDPDREKSLLSPEEEMSFGWVVAAWVGLGLDFVQAVHAVKALAKGAELAKVCEEAAQASGKVTKSALMDAARPHAESSAVWEGINEETKLALRKRPALVKTLEEHPLATKALKLCVAPKRKLARAPLCYKTFASEPQIARLEKALRRARDSNILVEMPEVQKAINRTKSPKQLTDTIETIEGGIEAQIAGATKAGQVAQEFREAGKVVKAGEHIAGASFDEGFYLTERMRHVPGKATGGSSLPYVTRLLPDGRIGQIPGQIAEKLRAIGHFDDFADFRATFWRLVADDPVLGAGWSSSNLTLMRSGRPPKVGSVGGVYQGVGGRSNAVLQLNHRQALEHAGQLYDLDNIEIVTPWFHRAIGQ